MKTTSRSQNIALRLLRLYPRGWRARYADEVTAVLEERPATFRTVFDLSLGMIDAYIHYPLLTEKEFSMQQRLRNSQVTIFTAFILFAIAWAVYAVLLARFWEYGRWSVPHSGAAPLYPGLANVQSRLALHIINFCGFCALAAAGISVIVLVAITIRQTLKKGQKGFALFGVAWLLSIVPLGYLLYYSLHFPLFPYTTSRFVSELEIYLPYFPVICWVFIGPACLVWGTRKAELPARLLRFAFVPTILITLAMSVILGAMLYLALELLIIAPLFNTLLSGRVLDLLVLWMALLTAFCYVSLWRGFRAQRALKPA